MRLTILTLLATGIGTLPASSQEHGFKSAFYPLDVGNEWHYRSGDEKVIIRVAGHDVVELADENGKPAKVLAAVLELQSGRRLVIEKVAVLADGVCRISTAGHTINPPLRFLKLPSRDGDTWVVQADSEGTPLKGKFTVSREVVIVPAGKFDAYVSTSRDFQIGDKKMSVTYWFAEDVGMVKQQVKVGNFERVLELEQFKGYVGAGY